MNKYLLVTVIFASFSLLLTLGHFTYMKATSFNCQTDLPPKPFIDESGEEYYVGGDSEIIITTKCNGGFLAHLNPLYPLN